MDLGEHFPCICVKDLATSIAFYEKLGFAMIKDHTDENWAYMQHNNMVLCLYQDHIDKNLINFRGGDIEAVVAEAEARGLEFTGRAEQQDDGGWSATIFDPDGNCIFFNTFPEEREEYVENGTLIDYRSG